MVRCKTTRKKKNGKKKTPTETVKEACAGRGTTPPPEALVYTFFLTSEKLDQDELHRTSSPGSSDVMLQEVPELGGRRCVCGGRGLVGGA